MVASLVTFEGEGGVLIRSRLVVALLATGLGVVVIGVAVVVPSYRRAEADRTRLECCRLDKGFDELERRTGRRATSLDELLRAGWKIENDPWGSPYRLENSGDRSTVSSAGRDRLPGTADDIRCESPSR